MFSENIFHWLKFKACLHNILFLWIFDFLLINFWFSFDLYCLEFISHYIKETLHVNANSKGNQSWNNGKEIDFLLFSDTDNENFNVKLKFLSLYLIQKILPDRDTSYLLHRTIVHRYLWQRHYSQHTLGSRCFYFLIYFCQHEVYPLYSLHLHVEAFLSHAPWEEKKKISNVSKLLYFE